MTLGIQLLLKTPVDDYYPEHQVKRAAAFTTPHITKLHQSLSAICLYNPFWNNFRLLNFFAKRNLHLSINELVQLKREAGVGTRQEIYKNLLQFYLNGSKLNENQLRFLERLNPAFCDRSVHTKYPGQILIYECLSPRRLSKQLKKPYYLHLFIDLFNSYLFGRFDLDRSTAVGSKVLNQTIVPFYQERDTLITTVWHSCKPSGTNQQNSEPQARWINKKIIWKTTVHSYGTIEAFEKFILWEFFEGLRLYATELNNLPKTFERWLCRQNSFHPFDKEFNFFQYFDLGKCLQISLD